MASQTAAAINVGHDDSGSNLIQFNSGADIGAAFVMTGEW